VGVSHSVGKRGGRVTGIPSQEKEGRFQKGKQGGVISSDGVEARVCKTEEKEEPRSREGREKGAVKDDIQEKHQWPWNRRKGEKDGGGHGREGRVRKKKGELSAQAKKRKEYIRRCAAMVEAPAQRLKGNRKGKRRPKRPVQDRRRRRRWAGLLKGKKKTPHEIGGLGVSLAELAIINRGEKKTRREREFLPTESR